MAELCTAARAEIDRVQEMGGAVAAVESGYLKSALVASHAARRSRVESGEDVVVGVNRFAETEPNPLTADLETAIQTVDHDVEAAAVAAVRPGVLLATSQRSSRRSPSCARPRRRTRTSCRPPSSAPAPG